MATKPKGGKPAPEPGTQIANWDEELAKSAAIAHAMEANTSTGSKPFFSVKGGILAFDGAPVPGNQMVVIVLSTLMENILYEGDYDPSVFSPPVCFAHAFEEADLKPHETVVERGQDQHPTCEGCPFNEWGSAEKGRGKACKNHRRLSLIPAGTIDKKTDEYELITDPDHYKKAKAAYLSIPVTSVANWAAFVKTTADVLKRPPFGVVALCQVVPDAKNQFAITWEVLEKVPDEVMGEVFERAKMEREAITFPVSLDERDEPEEKPRSRAAAAKPKRGTAAKGKAAQGKAAQGKAAPAKSKPAVKRKY